jgi:glycosyltransferase involved in cell wall biosynthesis
MLKALLRRVWSCLPRAARRRAFVAANAWRAPRPGAWTAATPLVIGGVFGSATGLGESARMNVAGAHRAGLPFATVDLTGSLLGEADFPFDGPAGDAPPAGPGSLVLHVSGPFIPYALARCGQQVVKGKKVVGFWHWELPSLPADWAVGRRFVHEVWVPSRFCAEAVGRDGGVPVRVIPHPVSVDGVRRRPSGVFTVLSMFNMASGFQRKNPLGSIGAFLRAFGDDPAARLILKILNPDAYPAGMAALREAAGGRANIRFVGEPVPRRTVIEMIAAADAVLSLHRSEGFGLLAAEAMLIGVPVIATDWSATTDFVTAETGLPIPYRLVPAVDPQGHYHFPAQRWAEPDLDAAAAALRKLRDDPGFADALAARGRTAVAEAFSADRYARRLAEIVV